MIGLMNVMIRVVRIPAVGPLAPRLDVDAVQPFNVAERHDDFLAKRAPRFAWVHCGDGFAALSALLAFGHFFPPLSPGSRCRMPWQSPQTRITSRGFE